MSNKPCTTQALTANHLADYIACTTGLQGKLAKIITHQQDSAASLSRAAAHLREIASLSSPINRNSRLNNETLAAEA